MSVAPIRQLKRKRGGGSFEQDFAYTGSVQSVTIPSKGLYKLEVWGAQGGYGGAGGYSVGYKEFDKDDVLYICVGGQGGNVTFIAQSSTGWYNVGGYNGGGHVYNNTQHNSGTVNAGGGGATHIAKVTGTIASIGKTSFVDNGNGLIVAGGGSGYTGGSGGGVSGSNGSGQGYTGSGGTQSSGGYNGMMSNITNGTFGQGGGAWTDDVYNGECGAGGGGLYGGAGAAINSFGDSCGGGGGSGYIGGVPQVTYKGHTYSPSTTNGANNGNGKAKITKIA